MCNMPEYMVLQLMMVPLLLSERSTPISPCSIVALFPAQHHRRGTDGVSNPLPYLKRDAPPLHESLPLRLFQTTSLLYPEFSPHGRENCVSFVVNARRPQNPAQKNLHVYAKPCVDKVVVLFLLCINPHTPHYT